jgi:type III restriction enzyme
VTRNGSGAESVEVQVRMREAFRGKRIMVPRVLHREGKKKYRDLDYEADVLACVDFEALSYRKAESFNVVAYDVGRQQAVAVDIAAGDEFELAATADAGVRIVDQPLDRPGLVRRMLDVVPNPWQGARILDEALATLRKRATEEAIIAARLTLVEEIKLDVHAQVKEAAERIFRDKVKSGDIVFKLLAAPLDDLNFTFLEQYTAHIASGDARAPLFHANGNALDRALYDKVYRKHFNGFEEQVALYLDGRDAVTWWWRIAARGGWGLQGWLRNKVYPDFLVRLDTQKQTARLLVLETKGKHLEGSADTTFKERFFQLLEEAYTIGKEAGEVELFSEAPDTMRFRILLQEEAWQNQVETALA